MLSYPDHFAFFYNLRKHLSKVTECHSMAKERLKASAKSLAANTAALHSMSHGAIS